MINHIVDSYFNHPYNNTIRNERCVEIPIALRYLHEHPDCVEIGAVLPYYCIQNHVVIDPTDYKATISSDAEDCDFTDKHVLSISTIEHLGTGDYGLRKDPQKCVRLLEKITKEATSYLISFPLGFNTTLDKYIKLNIEHYDAFAYIKQSDSPVAWCCVPKENKELWQYKYGSPYLSGNAVLFLEGER